MLLLLYPELANVHVKALIFPWREGAGSHSPLCAPLLFCSPGSQLSQCVREQWRGGPWGHRMWGNKMQYAATQIDWSSLPWSWRAGQAGGKCWALTQTINITGAGNTRAQRISYTAHLNHQHRRNVGTVLKIKGLQGFRCEMWVFKLSSDLATTVLIPTPGSGEYETRGSNYPGECQW